MYYISCTSLRPPYIIDPSFRSREKTVKLGDVASVGQPCKRAYSEVSGFELSIANLSKQEPLKPIEWRSLEVETTAHPTKWFHITTDNVVLLCILNGVIFTGYMEDVKEENFFLVGPVSSDRIIVLGLNNESGINPRYLAQTLQSDKCAVCKQLLAADYYAASSGLIYSILHTYIPNLSEAAQNKDVAETASRQLEQSDREWKQKFDEYENAVRERKHALSQEFLRMHAASKRLTKYCRNHDGKFDLKADIGRGSTVEDVIGRLESSIPEIGELINNIASTDTSLGQPETLNVIEELRHCSTKWPDGIKVEEEDFACTPQIPDNTFIEFPRELLHRIFFNIYDNAERHGFPENEAKKIIRIRWNLVGDMIEIRIANNGRPLRKTPYGYFTKAHRKSYQHKDGHRSEGIGNLQSKRYMEAFGGTVSLDKIDEGEFKVAYTLRFKLKHQ